MKMKHRSTRAIQIASTNENLLSNLLLQWTSFGKFKVPFLFLFEFPSTGPNNKILFDHILVLVLVIHLCWESWAPNSKFYYYVHKWCKHVVTTFPAFIHCMNPFNARWTTFYHDCCSHWGLVASHLLALNEEVVRDFHYSCCVGILLLFLL
jgi:hypothetical protein